MSKEIKLNKDDKVELSGKEYIVTVSGKTQLTLQATEDGKKRRVSLSSPAVKKIKVLEKAKVTEEPTAKKAPKKREGKKTEEKEEVKELDYDKFELESLNIMAKIDEDEEPHFAFPETLLISAWWYSIQRATKAQRIGYINHKLAKEGKDSLFGLMLALYKTRQEVKFDYMDLEERVLVDEVHVGKRAKKLSIKAIQTALKPMLTVSRNKVKQEQMDELIKVVPDDVNQGWVFYFLNSVATDWGSLKLSQQDLANITIPMA